MSSATTSPPRLFSSDHKHTGILFLLFSLGFFAVGGLAAMAMRWQLAWPGDPAHPLPLFSRLMHWPAGVMPPEFYNQLLSIHATIMVFFVVIPLLNSALGTYLIPLKIGARQIAFPRLSGLSPWLFLAAGTTLLAGFFLPGGAASAGWTSYAPLSQIPYNGGGFLPASPGLLHLLQSPNTTWPTLPILLNFAAWALLAGYIARQWLSIEFAVVAALLAAAAAVHAVQSIAFDGQACWFLSLILVSLSNLITAVTFLTTIAALRCPGMTMLRLPLTLWNLLASAMITLLATPVLTAALLMSLLDHHGLTHFFEPAGWTPGNSAAPIPAARAQAANATDGGVAMLFPHLFWFYSHPAVYIMMLPAMGIVSDIIPVFARKPLFGYRAMVAATLFIAVMGFVVWGHHLFQSGMNPLLGTTFAVSTLVIATPSGIKTFNWIATLWGGSIELTVPMLNAVAFVSLFVIGGLSGVVLASSAIDVQLHMTYFVVAHIHYVLFGGSMFGIFAGIYYWYPKMFGRMMNPILGYVHFVLSFITFNCTFFTMHFLGLAGMPRRIADYRGYTMFAHLQPMQQFISISAFGLGIAQLPFAINFLGSFIWGRPAPANPWRAATLEWTTTSPPPPQNFAQLPRVIRGPYEYSNPAAANDWLPQKEPV
jgi:cytochrome c oxidase subunit 1